MTAAEPTEIPAVLPREPKPEDLAIVPVDQLSPHPENPRLHDDAALEASIRAHGVVDICVVQRSTGLILGGHGRWENARKVGATTMPVLYVDCDDDEAREILLVLNATADRATYDLTAVVDIVERVRSRFDDETERVARSGWSEEAIDRARRDLAATRGAAETNEPDADFDSGAALRVEFGTEVGQLWQISGALQHRLLIGDAGEPENVSRLLEGEPIDLICTSPPYNVGVNYEQHDDEEVPWPAYREFILRCMRPWVPEMPDGRAVVWVLGVSRSCYHHRQAVMFEDDLGLRYWRDMVWMKSGVSLPTHHMMKNAMRVRSFTPNWRHEVLLIHTKGGGFQSGADLEALDELVTYDIFQLNQAFATRDVPSGTQRTGALRAGKGALDRRAKKAHPAVFPMAIPAAFALHLADPGAIVFDPFVGAGTTILAADQRGRRGAGVEISPEYAAVALFRAKALGMSVDRIG